MVFPIELLLEVETPMNQFVLIVRLTALLQLNWDGRVIVIEEDVLLMFLDRIFRFAFIKLSERLLFCNKYILEIVDDKEFAIIERLEVVRIYFTPPDDQSYVAIDSQKLPAIGGFIIFPSVTFKIGEDEEGIVTFALNAKETVVLLIWVDATETPLIK